MADKAVIEINGVKLEVDLRHAKRIDEIRVGDRVKVLVKGYQDYTVHPGIVIGFEPFNKLPTIVVAYVSREWSKAEIKFLHFNTQTKEHEIVKAVDDDSADLDKSGIMNRFDLEIETKRREIADIELRREYFLRNFRSYWEPVAKPGPAEVA